MENIEKQLDKLLIAVLDVKAVQGEMSARISHLEEQHARTFDKLDGFLMLINRHEAELAAMQAKYERLEDRILKLERA